MNKLKVVPSQQGAARVGSNTTNRVLVVDDNLDSVHSMAMLIKLFGHEVEFAINGYAAIDVARRFRPDVILLDMNLPGIAGDKLARQLKFEPGLERTRIIGVSGHADDATRQRALDAGCTAFYVTPVAPDVIEKLLSNASDPLATTRSAR